MPLDSDFASLAAVLLTIPLVALSFAIAINVFYLTHVFFTVLEKRLERYIKSKFNVEIQNEDY